MATEVYVGRIRSVVTHATLTILTLGVWFFVWYGQLVHELRRHRGAGPHPALALALFLLLPVIGWFVMPFLTGLDLRRVQRDADADKRSSPWYPALWGLVPIVGWAFAAGVLQAGANRAWTRLHSGLEGATSGPATLECPQCSNRFEQFLDPFGSNRVVCPKCGQAASV